MYAPCPYGKPGDRLWVRETWYCDHFEVMRGPYLKPDDLEVGEAIEDGTLVYAADGLAPYEQEQPTWKPSIHMPRWASRILLEITEVRVERLKDISRGDIRAEGLQCPPEPASDDVSPNYRDWTRRPGGSYGSPLAATGKPTRGSGWSSSSGCSASRGMSALGSLGEPDSHKGDAGYPKARVRCP
ncbi:MULTISPECIES: hypothetical protein [unclassified Pseudomonas]|uniref:hypothetical protein n=1 Tax=unclassified Pseudomonas TaxID=196821 RepID=UPI0030DA480D